MVYWNFFVGRVSVRGLFLVFGVLFLYSVFREDEVELESRMGM